MDTLSEIKLMTLLPMNINDDNDEYRLLCDTKKPTMA